MKDNRTKQKVMEAACRLFYAKGYHGTSVRDIAKEAAVNVSLINYYFNSKQGLLEAAVVSYYEEYLKQLDIAWQETEETPPLDRLKKIIGVIIQYKQDKHQFTCFIQRELTLDSVFVREMMVTYLAKEHHILSKLFYEVVKGTSNSQIDREFLLLQLKGLLKTPYMSPNEWKNLVSWDHQLFATKYIKSIHNWVDYVAQSSDAIKK